MANDIEVQTATVARAESIDEKFVGAKDVDEALQFLHAHAATAQLTEIDEKKLMRKVDWMIMPLMFAVYYLQYTDKTLRMTTFLPSRQLRHADLLKQSHLLQ